MEQIIKNIAEIEIRLKAIEDNCCHYNRLKETEKANSNIDKIMYRLEIIEKKENNNFKILYQKIDNLYKIVFMLVGIGVALQFGATIGLFKGLFNA